MNNLDKNTAMGAASYFGNNDTVLRQHCLELAIESCKTRCGDCIRIAEEYFDFIKGAGKDSAQELAPPSGTGLTASGIPIGECMASLRNAIYSDPGYAYSWHANIACAAMDEGLNHKHANQAATRFMKNLFGVTTSADMLHSKAKEVDAPTTAPQSWEVDKRGMPRKRFRPIMSGENLAHYHALRDRYDMGEVNENGFTRNGEMDPNGKDGPPLDPVCIPDPRDDPRPNAFVA